MTTLATYEALAEAESDCLKALQRNRLLIPEGVAFVKQGEPCHSAALLGAGWACSYKLLPDGNRQIINFHITGDLVGFPAALLDVSDRSIEAVTQVEMSEVPRETLMEVLGHYPRLSMAVLRAAAREEAAVADLLASLGGRDAVTRTAHLLLQFWVRLRRVGLGYPDGYDCPLSQGLLADALGVSHIHVNRCLRRLRELGLLTFHRGRVTFTNLPALIDFVEYDLVDPLPQGTVLPLKPLLAGNGG